MPEDYEDHKEEDESMVNALSSLGWIEEKDLEEEHPKKGDDALQEQLAYFKEQNVQLNNEIIKMRRDYEKLLQDTSETKRQKEKFTQMVEKNNDTIENLLQSISQKDVKINELETNAKMFAESSSNNEDMNGLQNQIEEQSLKIEELNFADIEKNKIIANQREEIDKINRIIKDQVQKIKELTNETEEFKSEKDTNVGLVEKLREKDQKIKELMEQLQYLDKDTVQKSKFEKLANELSVKDKIITEKEEIIFQMESSIESANKKTKEIQQQLETFSLVKKDAENKEKRINTLVLEVERLNQKNLTNAEFISSIQEKLEVSQERSGNLTGKFELEMANLRSLIDSNNLEIKELRENDTKLKNKIYEAEQIEDRLLSEMQNLKDDKLRFESE
ncbi:MAG: hypothetical protein KGD73_13280, partial [Candidatus Lokiarchaeota archaeon]|nr:hypothetical protein [Candidatus Lokiarchaeota archaeon]